VEAVLQVAQDFVLPLVDGFVQEHVGHEAGDIATLRDPGLPRVRTVVEAPFFTAGGRLVVRPGSDPESLYYYHAPSLALPPGARTADRGGHRPGEGLVL
jgi:hypothetical protein